MHFLRYLIEQGRSYLGSPTDGAIQILSRYLPSTFEKITSSDGTLAGKRTDVRVQVAGTKPGLPEEPRLLSTF